MAISIEGTNGKHSRFSRSTHQIQWRHTQPTQTCCFSVGVEVFRMKFISKANNHLNYFWGGFWVVSNRTLVEWSATHCTTKAQRQSMSVIKNHNRWILKSTPRSILIAMTRRSIPIPIKAMYHSLFAQISFILNSNAEKGKNEQMNDGDDVDDDDEKWRRKE